jgi:hypothetical protein
MTLLHVARSGALALAVASGLIALLPSGAAAAAKPAATPTPIPTAAPNEDRAMTARARAEFVALGAGKIDRSRYTKQAADALTDSVVASLSTQLKAFGEPQTYLYRGKTVDKDGTNNYYYTIFCEKGTLSLSLAVDTHDKFAGLSVGPE